MEKRKIKFKNFKRDLNEDLKKNEKLRLLYKVESAKLTVAEKLADIREKIGLTQEELAKKMNVSQQLISRIESGADNITLETLVKFCYAMKIMLKIDVEKQGRDREVVAFV